MRAIERRLVLVESRIMATRGVDRQAAHHRQSLRAFVKMCDVVRERLQAMGIDPELAVSLKRSEQMVAELAAIPDTDQLQTADEAIVGTKNYTGDNGRRASFEAQIERMAERCRDNDYQLDLAKASPAELLAFCVAVENEASVSQVGEKFLQPVPEAADSSAVHLETSLKRMEKLDIPADQGALRPFIVAKTL